MEHYPWLYHAHHQNYTEDLSFWLILADQQGDPILELGCGAGRVLLSLARAGHTVYGLDRDAQMLTVLQALTPPELRSSTRIFRADMTAFHLSVQFPLILLPCNTYSVLSAEERQAALDCVYRHLLPGGWFVASLPNPAMLSRLPVEGDSEVEEVFNHPVSGDSVQVSSSWERNEQCFLLRWHYDRLLPDGRVERLTVEGSHDLSPVEVYQSEIREAGLQLVATYGDFERAAFQRTARNLILVASRA